MKFGPSPCIMSVQYIGDVQCTGLISLGTSGSVQYTGGYHQYSGGCSVHWRIDEYTGGIP